MEAGMNLLYTALNSYNIPNPTQQVTDQRMTRWGKNNRYWAKAVNDGFIFGDFVNDISDYIFPRADNTLTKDEYIKHKNSIEQAQREAKEEQERCYLEVSTQAQKIWQELTKVQDDHPYLFRKQVASYNLRYNVKTNGLVIPLYDDNGKIWSLQYINEAGEKKFLFGGRKKGCYFGISKPLNNKLLVCEGYATGASLFKATGIGVAIAFDAGNLKPVCEALSKKYPNLEIFICADNDQFNEVNVGVNKANEAAHAINAKVIIPQFKDLSTKPTDFNDLYILEGKDAICRYFMSDEKQQCITWDNPMLFDELETPNIPSNILPSPLHEFAAALSLATETPESMAVMSLLAVVATALQGKFMVKASATDNYQEPLNIYTVTALPPANRKSAVLNACIRPLVEFETEQKTILEPEIKKQKSRYESEKKLLEIMRNKLKDGCSESLIEEIAQRETNLKDPDLLPRLFVNDATPESLAGLLAENKAKIAILSDEGGIIETMAGLYTGGNANIDILLKGWDGGYVRLKRKDRDLNFNPLLTINLIVQPVIIQNMSSKRTYSNKGFLERFLYCIPKSKLGYRTHNTPPIPPEIINSYNLKIKQMLNINVTEKTNILILDNRAHSIWREFQRKVEIDLRPNGKLSICQGWGGKICGYALRIAGLLHVTEYSESNTIINNNTMIRAIEICRLLIDHAVVAFGYMNLDTDIQKAKDILDWIKDIESTSFTKADLTKKFRHRMSADEIEVPLSILIRRNIIGEPIKEGKKTIKYEINPILLKQWQERLD